MASSATRWVRWRIKVKAHVLALICPFTARCSGCGIAIGAWQPGLQAEECQQRYKSRTTPDVPCLTRHAQNAKPTSRCRTVAPWSIPLHHGASRCTMEHHDATGVTTPRQTVKASPHWHKWMLSHGALADPSDPWNSPAAPVSPRQIPLEPCALGLASTGRWYIRTQHRDRQQPQQCDVH